MSPPEPRPPESAPRGARRGATNPRPTVPARVLGLCAAPRRAAADPTSANRVGRLAWAVVALASGRMAYLQHGLLAAGRPPDEIQRGYEPAAVALLGELPQGTPARLLAAMPPRTPPGAVLAYSQTDLGRAFGPDPESAVVRLLSLPATPRPPAACSALAAAALLAMGTAPDDRRPGVVPLAGRGPVHRAPPARPPSLPF